MGDGRGRGGGGGRSTGKGRAGVLADTKRDEAVTKINGKRVSKSEAGCGEGGGTRSGVGGGMKDGGEERTGVGRRDREDGGEGGQRLYVVRHGERVDFTLGSNWTKRCFIKGEYVRYDQNMPTVLPTRLGGVIAFQDDSPLTRLGHFQAQLLGETMRDTGVRVSHVYSSPALRCVQTAADILHGLGRSDHPIHIEPGLFEWLAWHPRGLPTFMTSRELRAAGFNVIGHRHKDFTTSHNTERHNVTSHNIDRHDVEKADAATDDFTNNNDIPLWTEWNVKETVEDYYNRCHVVTKTLLDRHKDDGGNVLLVAHKGSVDVCTRQLVGKPPLRLKMFKERVQKVPYCAVACCRLLGQEEKQLNSPSPCRVDSSSYQWILCDSGLPIFTHSGNVKYDWSIWL